MAVRPQLPVTTAEMLYVSLGHVLDYVDEHGELPKRMSDNMRQVLSTYARERTKILKATGATPESVNKYTATAAASLIRWLNMQALQEDSKQEHFDKWTEELDDRQDDHGVEHD